MYKLARSAGHDAAPRDQIAYIVSQFVGFQQLQRPFLQVFEDVAKTAAKYPEIEQEAAALRAAVSERDAVVAAADGRANAAEGHLAEALAEIEQQQAQIAQVATERDEASGLKATLAEREKALADLSRRADEFLAALQTAQAETAAREAALRRAEQEAQGSSTAAEALDAEVGALREALAQAEREAQERRAAAATLEAAIAMLRKTLAQAEREAQERAVSAEALRAEIVALQGTLAAAREVGKAAVTAFRIDTAAPTNRDEPGGWWQAIMRFFGARTSF
jgi:colicin import membrane protein